jgi:succinyl-CoA synthetase beta subunit
MDLLEYQAKQLFQEVGIPILPSQTLSNPSQIKNLTLPYPIVLKSQVRVSGRGKLGGVRFAHNSIDAIAAAHTIFNLSILGEYPEVLLAEARYDSREELFLAIVLDYHLQKPVLMGSVQGGI